MLPRLRAILTDEAAQIFDQFTVCMGVRISFFDAEGQLIKRTTDERNAQFCTYCQEIRELYGPGRCDAEDACAFSRALTLGMHSYTCHAGLMESVVPMYVHGCLFGYVMIGQIRGTGEMPGHVAEDARQASRFQRLYAAYHELEVTSQDRFDAILRLLSVTAHYILSNRLVSLNVSSLVTNALCHMRDHVSERLTIQDLADHLAVSPSTLFHAFADELGTSFKQMFLEMKLGKAEELMMADPSVSVTQVAHHTGFDEPSHFSRMYKNRRGYPPSAFLARQRESRKQGIAVHVGIQESKDGLEGNPSGAGGKGEPAAEVKPPDKAVKRKRRRRS